MFEKWSTKKIIIVLGGALLLAGITQIILFFYTGSFIVHFGMSFIALFIALLLFYSLNIRSKKVTKQK